MSKKTPRKKRQNPPETEVTGTEGVGGSDAGAADASEQAPPAESTHAEEAPTETLTSERAAVLKQLRKTGPSLVREEGDDDGAPPDAEAVATASQQTASDDGGDSGDSAPADEGAAARQHLKRVLEGLIFVSDRPLSAAQLAKHVSTTPSEIKPLLAELVEEYEPRGVQLVEVATGYVFRSAPLSAPFVRDLIAQKPVRLTRAQLETLAIIAYRQPVTRPEIDDIRGVDSGSAIKVLLERGLLKMVGRKDEAGRPMLYGTHPYFLEFFGLKSLKDLPTLREFTELTEESRNLFERRIGEPIENLEHEQVEAKAEETQADEAQAAPIEGPSDEGPGDQAQPAESSEALECVEDEAVASAAPEDVDTTATDAAESESEPEARHLADPTPSA